MFQFNINWEFSEYSEVKLFFEYIKRKMKQKRIQKYFYNYFNFLGDPYGFRKELDIYFKILLLFLRIYDQDLYLKIIELWIMIISQESNKIASKFIFLDLI